jgi:hypothetical protein
VTALLGTFSGSPRSCVGARSAYAGPTGGRPLSWASAAAFRRHFWQPPRAHGDVIEGREVSFLELFYDLVYVVVVSQAARHLAGEGEDAHLEEHVGRPATTAPAGRFVTADRSLFTQWSSWLLQVSCPCPTAALPAPHTMSHGARHLDNDGDREPVC